MMKNKIIFSVIFLFIIIGKSNAQDYLNDSMFQRLDFDSMELFVENDSIDIVEGDFFDTGTYDTNSIFATDANWTRYSCRSKENVVANRTIGLLQKEWVWVEIFNDDFNDFDKQFWQNQNMISNGNANWDHFASFKSNICGTEGVETGEEDGVSKALYLNSTESVVDGKLQIDTKYQPITIKWNYNGNYYDPLWSTTTKTFEYISGRVESNWAFDGSMDLVDGKFTSDEGGIRIVSKIKHPNEAGLLPAFWMVGYASGDNSYDEFDVFEYFNADGKHENKMAISMYSLDNDPNKKCNTVYTINKPNEFHTYIYNWNQFATSVFVDDKKTARYCRHQFSRPLRVGKFPQTLTKDIEFNKRKRYNRLPMRINFNTGVYCSIGDINKSLNTKYEVDYIAVFKKFPCAQNEVFDEPSDLKIQHGVYNVGIANEAIFNFSSTLVTPIIPDQDMYKLIANEEVVVTNFYLSKNATFIIEHDRICHNSAPISPEDSTSVIGDSKSGSSSQDFKNQINKNNLNETLAKDQIKTVIKDGYLSVLKADNFVKIELYDLSGKLLLKFSKINNVSFKGEIKNIVNGVYVIKGEGKEIKKSFSKLISINNE